MHGGGLVVVGILKWHEWLDGGNNTRGMNKNISLQIMSYAYEFGPNLSFSNVICKLHQLEIRFRNIWQIRCVITKTMNCCSRSRSGLPKLVMLAVPFVRERNLPTTAISKGICYYIRANDLINAQTAASVTQKIPNWNGTSKRVLATN